MNECTLDGFLKHLPRTHRTRLELTALRTQIVELKSDLEEAEAAVDKLMTVVEKKAELSRGSTLQDAVKELLEITAGGTDYTGCDSFTMQPLIKALYKAIRGAP